MAAQPRVQAGQPTALLLAAFDPVRHADAVASWIRSDYEAYLVAPRSAPPITPTRIREWGGPGKRQFVLRERSAVGPVAYGELNALENRPDEYWLGHVLVAPGRRGEGIGTRLTRILLRHAFERLAARRVSLVVFTQNYAAIAAYKAAGMVADGMEVHEFPHYNRTVRLLRMVATPDE